MDTQDFSELVLPFVKTSSFSASYDVLCKVNTLFYKELKPEIVLQSVQKWFQDKSARFFWEHTNVYYLSSVRVNNSIEFNIVTSSNGSDEESHLGIVSFNDDNTVSMSIHSDENDKSIVSRSFSDIKSLEMLKTIFIDNDFHSVSDDDDEDDDDDDKEDNEEVNDDDEDDDSEEDD